MNITSAAPFFQGQISVQYGDGWVQPWRLPFAALDLFPSNNDQLRVNASHTAGVRLRFTTDAAEIRVLVEPLPETEPRKFDLTLEGELLQTFVLDAAAEEILFQLPDNSMDKAWEVWLPSNAPVRVRGLAVDSGSTLLSMPDWRPRWTTYGSSITKCGAAHSPARTWPAVAARKHNLNLTCLGYGGQCHLEPLVGMVIRDLPADLISLKLGINVHGGGTLSSRTFKPAVLGLVQIIREKQPRTPIALISPIISPPREQKPHIDLSLEDMRREIADATLRLRAAGDCAIEYFDGLKMFGAADNAYLPDQLHPDGDGYELLGHRIADQVLSRFKAVI